MLYVLAGLGLLIVIVLSVIAYRSVSQLRQQQLDIARAKEAHEQRQIEKLNYVTDSIHVIAQCYLQQQVDLPEASIRLAKCLDQLPLSCGDKQDYGVFFQINEAIKHIPTHDAWKSLHKSERMKFQIQLADIIHQYEDFAIAAAEKLIRDERFLPST